MCDAMMEILKDRIDEISIKSREDGLRIGWEDGLRIGREDGLRIGRENGKQDGILLTKQIFRMNADGVDYETIASKCYISVAQVKEILNF